MCEEGTYAYNNKCIPASECSVKDEEKRICKDFEVDDLDENLSLIVEYVKTLRNGHTIKIIVPSVLLVFQKTTES